MANPDQLERYLKCKKEQAARATEKVAYHGDNNGRLDLVMAIMDAQAKLDMLPHFST